jgi:hypothetical protein
MSLSGRERRILAQIELELRKGDQAFARRIEALNASAARQCPQHFAGHTSGRELVCVLLFVVVLAALPWVVILHAGRTCPRLPAARSPVIITNGLTSEAERARQGDRAGGERELRRNC